MKIRSLLSFLIILSLFLLGGCSALFQRAAPPQEVALTYHSGDPTENAACRNQGAVVSIVTIGSFRVGIGLGAAINVYSGFIVNREGYVVSTSEAALPVYTDTNGDVYEGRATAVYAVLSDVYQTGNAVYKLEIIDVDSDFGLALFKFYDHFYYDSENVNLQDETVESRVVGFPIIAEISSLPLAAGDSCVAVGNSVGNIVNELQNPFSLEYVYLSATTGIIASVGQATGSFHFTAAVVPEMRGGAVFDQNGYLVGLVSKKLNGQSNAGKETFLTNLAEAIDSETIVKYLNNVSQTLRVEIPYTLAKSEAAA